MIGGESLRTMVKEPMYGLSKGVIEVNVTCDVPANEKREREVAKVISSCVIILRKDAITKLTSIPV